MIEKKERPDLEPGFWPEYVPPASEVARAVQYPEDDRFFARMVSAYMKDERDKRTKK